MAQRDPLNEYKSEAFELFRQLIAQWHEGVIAQMMRIEVRFQPPPEPAPATQFQHLDPVSHMNEAELGLIAEPINAAFSVASSAYEAAPAVADRDPNDPKTWGRTGRNEPCPCGSGKKFKHCHGVLV
jgi:preprotein translocase subunit SecA